MTQSRRFSSYKHAQREMVMAAIGPQLPLDVAQRLAPEGIDQGKNGLSDRPQQSVSLRYCFPKKAEMDGQRRIAWMSMTAMQTISGDTLGYGLLPLHLRFVD